MAACILVAMVHDDARAGGPYYAPRSVRVAALEVLDALFPMGRRSRRLVRLVFRVLHPAEFLGALFFMLLLPVRAWSALSRAVLRAAGAVTAAASAVLFAVLRLLRLVPPHGAAAAAAAAAASGASGTRRGEARAPRWQRLQ